jgi:dTDP-glucose 4,6-dehydratase
MIPSFISQALAGWPLTIYGDGSQTGIVQYVDDLIEGVWLLMKSFKSRPVNVGNPQELTVREIAELIVEISSREGELVHEPLPEDDPKRSYPDISCAR